MTQPTPPTLHQAALNLVVDDVAACLENGADPNEVYNTDGTPLMWLYAYPQYYDDRRIPPKRRLRAVDKIARMLIEAGADVDAEGYDKLRPLHLALGMYPYNFNVLIQAGADVNAPTTAYWTPLMLANTKATKALLKAGANPGLTNCYEQTPLHLCTSPEKADMLIEAGARAVPRDRYGRSPAMVAVLRGDLEMVKYHWQFKYSRFGVDDSGASALDLAERMDHKEVVDFLKTAPREGGR